MQQLYVVIQYKQYKVSNFKFKVLPRGFPQHSLLNATYFCLVLDSVAFKKLEKSIYKCGKFKAAILFSGGQQLSTCYARHCIELTSCDRRIANHNYQFI
jgi:hypothetical protein